MSITSVVTSKGQMTLPAPIRKAFKIGTQNRRVRFELCKDGSARIYPVTDALSLKGVFADPSRPYDPKEREKAWAAVAREAARKGLR
ncbi:MAG: type II toxin-antitoxin system PrlF family antitoxin [Methylacidiphilales bacterium]|nr:type II toxin-antitoxin system PrlF family antitoxin [Candidatus Methylacidiphilales bacterium]